MRSIHTSVVRFRQVAAGVLIAAIVALYVGAKVDFFTRYGQPGFLPHHLWYVGLALLLALFLSVIAPAHWLTMGSPSEGKERPSAPK